jgi:GH24 family phage-related lysozyme (muramidase)
MNISPQALEVMKHHEGVRFKPYRCPALLWTIGVGHLMYPSQARLPMPERMSVQLTLQDNKIFTKEEIDAILRKDLSNFERGVTN